MRHRTSVQVVQRNHGLLQRIQALKAERPFWGYRRIWAYLKFVDRLAVNKKRVLRLMRQADLLVKPNRRLRQQFPEGARGHDVHLMSDNGCQPTSVVFMAACNRLDVYQTFTSYNNRRGNADTERMVRTIKEELIWLREWTSPFELAEALEAWIKRYNAEYVHSALGYKSPIQCELAFKNSRQTQFLPA
ncbi:MAG: IS3 family transposase [Candidatus Omnitrophica bacterium]|nr:IS3 family transposase [Candidatus Omnitrophota bacterium]